MIPFSILDLSPIVEGGDAALALQNTIDLAQHAEAGVITVTGLPSITTFRRSRAPQRRSSSAPLRRTRRASASAPAASCCRIIRRSSLPSSSAHSNRCIPDGSISRSAARRDPISLRPGPFGAIRRRGHVSAGRARAHHVLQGAARVSASGRFPARASAFRSGFSGRACLARSWRPSSACRTRLRRICACADDGCHQPLSAAIPALGVSRSSSRDAGRQRRGGGN